MENDIITDLEPIEEIKIEWGSTELVIFDSLYLFSEAPVKKFLSLQNNSCMIKTYHYQKERNLFNNTFNNKLLIKK